MILTINDEFIDNKTSYLTWFINNKKINDINDKLNKLTNENHYLRLFLYRFIIGGILNNIIH